MIGLTYMINTDKSELEENSLVVFPEAYEGSDQENYLSPKLMKRISEANLKS